MTNFNSISESDRDWLAFGYISGELDENETSAFEAELETSQVAREAVARAVELTQAIARAESQQVELVEAASRSSSAQSARQKSWLVPAGWMTAGGVAGSVAGLGWANLGCLSPPENKGTAGAAGAWAKTSESVRSLWAA